MWTSRENAVADMAPSNPNKNSGVVSALVFFILVILPSIGLFISALTIWLAQLLDSAIYACLIVGGALLLVAVLIYLIKLRCAVKRMQERMETIYETSRLLQSGFEWINEKIAKFLG